MHFMNNGHLVAGVARLVRAQGGAVPTLEALPAAYRAMATELRPAGLEVQSDSLTITYEDGSWAEYCQENAIFAHIFNGAGQTDRATREACEGKVREALQLIEDIHPGLRYMVDLLITDLIILNSGADGGGSASHMPGVVVMSPGPRWETLDYAMCLVHEGLHLGLFVLDKVYSTFTLPSVELHKDQHRALSAVKIGQMRPLDKAFHAAAVTVPLMYMEYRCGKTALVDQYTKSLADACESLEKQRTYFTPYGAMLLDELSAFGKNIDFELAERSITDPQLAGYRPQAA
ncbi:HEXXH motif-containing putative peptide modification protein [Streptomyces sp. B-S-A8]|uniref:HEXXH motif-containing putative peptide modification protein n=1 Tax=Streptomyces solicavernae TaxID=3043614 RepID=A0ABT6S1V7_9ACTN|nr:HEXXH motif-containing putative peptide modification protein [Streptomyces sp. B-S-A8]MDI3390663.1 HEXXH motif-containing putative peptide modification protein [Streptomyces sp. B-S-A8]